jgi:hypothetical protein
VPATATQRAVTLLEAHLDRYMRFAVDARILPSDTLRASFPRFKVVGLRVLFALAPADALHFRLDAPDAVVHGRHSGLPFPLLAALAQSLLDAKNFTDLEDLVDGMDLTTQWAANMGLRISDNSSSRLGQSEREIWEEIVASKQTRMGFKYAPKNYTTCFIRRGRKPQVRF